VLSKETTSERKLRAIFTSRGLRRAREYAGVPLQDAPQTSHMRTAFSSLLPSRRLPQSVQKIREPIADMLLGCCYLGRF